MSSLEGALVPPEPKTEEKSEDLPDDVEMETAPEDTTVSGEPDAADTVEEPKPEEDEDEPMADLFGEDNDVTMAHDDSPESGAQSRNVSDGLSTDEQQHRKAMEYDEEDEAPADYEQVLEADVQIPNIPVPRSSDGNFWVIRTPNFMQVDSKPFHPDTYVGPEQDDEEMAPTESLREKSMTIKLKVENTVRWRWIKDENGNDRKQSNSRIIRWSDGSLSLLLGKELFDITQTVDTSAAVPRSGLGASQATQNSQNAPGPSQSPAPGPKAAGLTYLVAQHKRAFILQSEAVVSGYMTLRPTGMQSETHRMLVRAVGQKHNKVARLRMAPDPTMDPEREKMELLKMVAKKPKKARMEEEGYAAAGRRRRTGTSKRRSDMVWSDEEDEERDFAGSEEEEDPFDNSRKGRIGKGASDRGRGGDYLEDDFLVADSEEEGDAESDGGAGKRKRKHREEEEEESEGGGEDALDKLDAKIEEEERKRRKRDPDAGKAVRKEEEEEEIDKDGEQEMDVESEEEEEEFKIRKAGSGQRKKRMIDFDEEEEE